MHKSARQRSTDRLRPPLEQRRAQDFGAVAGVPPGFERAVWPQTCRPRAHSPRRSSGRRQTGQRSAGAVVLTPPHCPLDHRRARFLAALGFFRCHCPFSTINRRALRVAGVAGKDVAKVVALDGGVSARLGIHRCASAKSAWTSSATGKRVVRTRIATPSASWPFSNSDRARRTTAPRCVRPRRALAALANPFLASSAFPGAGSRIWAAEHPASAFSSSGVPHFRHGISASGDSIPQAQTNLFSIEQHPGIVRPELGDSLKACRLPETESSRRALQRLAIPERLTTLCFGVSTLREQHPRGSIFQRGQIFVPRDDEALSFPGRRARKRPRRLRIASSFGLPVYCSYPNCARAVPRSQSGCRVLCFITASHT